MESKIGAQTTASGDAADHRWRGRQIKRGCGDADRLTNRLKNKRLRKSREREAERGSGHPEWVCGICAKTNWITGKLWCSAPSTQTRSRQHAPSSAPFQQSANPTGSGSQTVPSHLAKPAPQPPAAQPSGQSMLMARSGGSIAPTTACFSAPMFDSRSVRTRSSSRPRPTSRLMFHMQVASESEGETDAEEDAAQRPPP